MENIPRRTKNYRQKGRIIRKSICKTSKERKLTEMCQIFEKKTLESNFKRDRGSSRQDTEQVYELLKKEVMNLDARVEFTNCLLGEQLGPIKTSFYIGSS
jgi:hypothetical protein